MSARWRFPAEPASPVRSGSEPLAGLLPYTEWSQPFRKSL
jgi:hypothetical protein